MKKSVISVLIFFIVSMGGGVSAQQPVPTPIATPVRNVNEARDLSRRSAEISNPQILAEDDNDRDRSFRPLSPIDLSKAARSKIKLSKDEKALYDKIADDNKLKILKIFSAPQCAENRLVLDARDEKCAAAADLLRVSFYSFLIGYYGETIGDFRVLEDNMIAGNGRNIHGFLVDLGEIEIGGIGKDSAEAVFLRNYPAAVTNDEASRQLNALEKGFTYQNFKISSKQKLQAAHVYLMRLVSYRSENDPATMYNKDSIYVFKVGGLNDDGMAVILWRRLSHKNAPQLKDE